MLPFLASSQCSDAVYTAFAMKGYECYCGDDAPALGGADSCEPFSDDSELETGSGNAVAAYTIIAEKPTEVSAPACVCVCLCVGVGMSGYSIGIHLTKIFLSFLRLKPSSSSKPLNPFEPPCSLADWASVWRSASERASASHATTTACLVTAVRTSSASAVRTVSSATATPTARTTEVCLPNLRKQRSWLWSWCFPCLWLRLLGDCGCFG